MAVIAMLVSSAVFGYVMNRIANILESYNTTPKEF